MKSGRCGSDITMADFWGIEHVSGEKDDDKGTSLILINTKKGDKLFKRIDGTKKEVKWQDAIRYNPSWHTSYEPHKNRSFFFRYYPLFKHHFAEFVNYATLDKPIPKRVERRLNALLFLRKFLKIKINDNRYYHILSVTR